MHYEGNIIRPPNEADSIILQVTTGCSHNKCTFCGAYKNQPFTIKSTNTISKDIAYAAKYFKNQRRVFLCDGDAIVLPQKRLIAILDEIQEKLPWISRVGLYANAKRLKLKNFKDLKELKEKGVGTIYMGLESGDDEVLNLVHKGETVSTIIEQGKKVREAGLKLSITVLLGLAGPERSLVHAKKTGEALSKLDPDIYTSHPQCQNDEWHL